LLFYKALELATQLRDATKWSDPIENPNDSVLFAVIDPNTGVFGGGTRYSNLLYLYFIFLKPPTFNTRPFNEYYLVAYLANMTSAVGSKANQYFETYYGTLGQPAGDGFHPVHKTYKGYDLLTDYHGIFMSSFIPQFNFFLSRSMVYDCISIRHSGS